MDFLIHRSLLGSSLVLHCVLQFTKTNQHYQPIFKTYISFGPSVQW